MPFLDEPYKGSPAQDFANFVLFDLVLACEFLDNLFEPYGSSDLHDGLLSAQQLLIFIEHYKETSLQKSTDLFLGQPEKCKSSSAFIIGR